MSPRISWVAFALQLSFYADAIRTDKFLTFFTEKERFSAVSRSSVEATVARDHEQKFIYPVVVVGG